MKIMIDADKRKMSSIILNKISLFCPTVSSEKHPQLISNPLRYACVRAIMKIIRSNKNIKELPLMKIPTIKTNPEISSRYGITIAKMFMKTSGRNL